MSEGLITTFFVGVVGALVVVYLRWIGAFPRFKSSLEIDKLEDEYKVIQETLTAKLKEKEVVTQPEVEHSNNLRDDIWRQKSTGFLGWAVIYVLLGGAIATLFGGEIQSLSDVATITKVASIGAFWTSFISLFDTKLADRAAEEARRKIDEKYAEAMERVKNGTESKIDEANKVINAKKAELRTLAEKYNRDIGQLTDEYNKMVEEYNKLFEKCKELKEKAKIK
ncbi:MAG: hypothetical protein H3Z49_02305 [archaeon]|nr:hypothetical protein [archaeon]